jgi:hypothetical protein
MGAALMVQKGLTPYSRSPLVMPGRHDIQLVLLVVKVRNVELFQMRHDRV